MLFCVWVVVFKGVISVCKSKTREGRCTFKPVVKGSLFLFCFLKDYDNIKLLLCVFFCLDIASLLAWFILVFFLFCFVFYIIIVYFLIGVFSGG